MTGTDAEIIRNIRRELGKRPIDPTRVDIQVVNGRVTIGGILGFKREEQNISLEAEMEIVAKIITRDRLVKDFVNQIHYARRNETTEETNARGRTRRARLTVNSADVNRFLVLIRHAARRAFARLADVFF